MKQLKKLYYTMGVSMTLGMMSTTSAFAGGGGNTGVEVTSNLVESISKLPSLLSALSYLAGMTFGVLGVLKVKDHIEQPTQVKLQEGAVRLGAGAGLLALPMLFEVMTNSFGSGGAGTSQATLDALQMN